MVLKSRSGATEEGSIAWSRRVAGRLPRLALLVPQFGDLTPYLEQGRRLGAMPDDVLDAFAMLYPAQRIVRAAPEIRLFPSTPEPAMAGKTAQIVA